jgi:L-asparagine transporter-like permease
VSVLASHIRILGYLLRHLPSRANLLTLLLLFLGVLLLYFLPLLGLFRVLRYLPPIILIMLWLKFLLPKLAFILLTFIYLFSISLTSIILQ